MTTLIVAAAVIERPGLLLVTRRQKGAHLEGCWEFPGGKCNAGETLQSCLARELREELAVVAHVGPEMFVTSHAYPDRRVELHFFKCEISGDPVPQIGQDLRWVTQDELRALEFPPADAELIEKLTRG